MLETSRAMVFHESGRPLELCRYPFPRLGDGEILVRITWSVAAACWSRFFCQDGLPQKCERLFKYGHERTSDRRPLGGGLADYCHLAPGTAVFRLPPPLSDAVACPANCATATCAAAMRYAGPCEGRVVLVDGWHGVACVAMFSPTCPRCARACHPTLASGGS